MSSSWNLNFDASAESLQGPVREALEVILLVFAGQPFTLESVNKAACGSVSGADLRAALPALLRQGWITAAKNTWGERIFYIRQEALSPCAKMWLTPLLSPVESAAVIGISGSVYREGKPGLAWDLFRVLRCTAEHGLPVTSKGVIHQKIIRKLTGQMDLSSADVRGLGLTYHQQEMIPPQLAIILDCMLELDLIREEQSRWLLNEDRLGRWLELSLAEMEQQLYKLVLHKYVPSLPVLQHVVHILDAPSISDGNWYALSDLAMHVEMCSQRRGLRPAGRRKALSDWIGGWLEALCAFGWMELVVGAEEGITFFRWVSCPRTTALKEEHASSTVAEPFLIQPDYELLVPPGVPFKLRWELENYCEPVILDRMSVYRIHSSRVKASALAGHRSIQDVMEFLDNHSTGIPEPIRLSLQHWFREVQRYGDPHDENKKDSVPLYHLPAMTRVDSYSEKADRQWFMMGNPSRGMITPLQDLSIYEPVDEVLDVAQLFPGLEEVPGMWFKVTRNYHDSTARKLIAQALEWRMKVELQMQGKPIEFLPVAVEGDKDWRIHGIFVNPSRDGDYSAHMQGQGRYAEDRSETIIYPQDFEGLRLILPETLYAK